MDKNPIEIVRLPVDEWASYKTFRLAMLQEAPYAFGASYQDNLARPASYWQNRLAEAAEGQTGWLLFARRGSELAGMIGAHLADEAPQVPVIISVYVAPAFRGLGVGKALMSAILEELRARGFRRVVLGVNAEFPAAVGLYRRFGFTVIEQNTSQMGDGQTYAGYRMAKDLDDENLP